MANGDGSSEGEEKEKETGDVNKVEEENEAMQTEA